MKSVGIVAAILLALDGAAFAGEVEIRYSFDEADGARAADSGPLKAHATLVAGSDLPLTDVSFVTKTTGQWQPLLRGDVQLKGILPDGFRLMLDSEAPIIVDRGADYEVDLERGLVKPLAGGRMKERDRVLVELSHRNPGPPRVAGYKGRALHFDGKDAFVEGGEPEGMKGLSVVTLNLWFQVGPDRNPSAVLIGKGEGLWLGLEQDALVFHQGGLQ